MSDNKSETDIAPGVWMRRKDAMKILEYQDQVAFLKRNWTKPALGEFDNRYGFYDYGGKRYYKPSGITHVFIIPLRIPPLPKEEK